MYLAVGVRRRFRRPETSRIPFGSVAAYLNQGARWKCLLGVETRRRRRAREVNVEHAYVRTYVRPSGICLERMPDLCYVGGGTSTETRSRRSRSLASRSESRTNILMGQVSASCWHHVWIALYWCYITDTYVYVERSIQGR
jgi:hypothetical protein